VSERLEYSRFTLLDVDPAKLDAAPLEALIAGATSRARSVNVLDEPAAQAWYEDWLPNEDIEWTCWTHEFHVILKGTAEVTYHNPPAWAESGTVTVGPGSMYLVPRGCKFRVHVTSNEPLRHLTFDFPNPGFPT
jgi:hypothetical protein